MRDLKWWSAIAAGVASAMWLSAAEPARADAIVSLSGSDSNSGALDLASGSYSLWTLLGGSTSTTTTTNSSGTTITYGDITTSTPTGDNSKNAILRDFLVVTDSSGHQSVVSLGEIDPTFVGTANSGAIGVTVSGSTASLTFLGAQVRRAAISPTLQAFSSWLPRRWREQEGYPRPSRCLAIPINQAAIP